LFMIGHLLLPCLLGHSPSLDLYGAIGDGETRRCTFLLEFAVDGGPIVAEGGVVGTEHLVAALRANAIVDEGVEQGVAMTGSLHRNK
jgi:hypothetical protein